MESSYTFDTTKFKLGKLCAKGHRWNDTDFSLRELRGKCVQCRDEYRQQWYQRNRESELEKARHRQKRYRQEDPQTFNAYHAAWKRRHRAIHGQKSRSKYVDIFLNWNDLGLDRNQIYYAIRQIKDGRLSANDVCLERVAELMEADAKLKALRQSSKQRVPSVAQLVYQEQIAYWEQNPDEMRKAKNEIKKNEWRLRYLIDERLRLYTRQKSKHRKAQMKQLMAIQVPASVLRKRFAEFGDQCAYCGEKDDLHIEHVVPISKGGPHSIGNIVPACKSCNFSKAAREVEEWYRAQPFFSETRWRKIKRVLGWHRSAVGQLAFL